MLTIIIILLFMYFYVVRVIRLKLLEFNNVRLYHYYYLTQFTTQFKFFGVSLFAEKKDDNGNKMFYTFLF